MGLGPRHNRSVTYNAIVLGLGIYGAFLVPMALSAQEDDSSKNGSNPHASIAAYPNAVISLKDPKSAMVFYVESNGRRLVAIDKDGTMAWSVDVLAVMKIKPFLEAPVIRNLSLQDGELRVTIAKNDEVRIQVISGKARYFGRD